MVLTRHICHWCEAVEVDTDFVETYSMESNNHVSLCIIFIISEYLLRKKWGFTSWATLVNDKFLPCGDEVAQIGN